MTAALALALLVGPGASCRVEVDPVAGQAIVEGAEPGAPRDSQDPLALGPPPGALEHYWVFPNRLDRQRLRAPPEPARTRRVVVHLPRRFGLGGCVDGRCALLLADLCGPGADPEAAQIEARRGRWFRADEVLLVGVGLHAEHGPSGWLFVGRRSGRRALEVAARAAGGATGGTILELPLRRELAVRRGSAVLVSDRLFDVAPPLRIHHERALALAVAVGREPPPVNDLRRRAAALGFVPAVDELLFARQVEFPEAYFFAEPPPRWKLVWLNLGALLTAPTLSLEGSIDLGLRRSDDLRNLVRVGVLHDAATEIGGFAGYVRGFGRAADPHRLAGALGLTLSGGRLDERFAGLGQSGTSASATAGLSWDDRPWPVDPWRWKGGALEATWRRVAVGELPAAEQGILTGSVEGGLPLAPGLVVAALGRGGGTFGDLQTAAQLLPVGGPTGLRGFGADELLGRGFALGRAELRRTFARAWDLDLAHLVWGRGFGMALFWEGALVASCEAPTRWEGYEDLGLTFRAFFDWAGLLPSTLELDLAWALDRRRRDCLGRQTSPGESDGTPRSPTAVLLRLGPSF